MMSRWHRFNLRRRPKLGLIREIHYAMGSLLDVTLYHADRTTGLSILREACQEATRLEALLSHRQPSSELCQLNAGAGQGPCDVSPALFEVLAAARGWAQWTRGAFDPTLGSVSTLWRQAARSGIGPEARQVEAVLRGGGWSKLRLIPPDQVELTTAGMRLDLGGIGKGYAVDQMGRLLRQGGVRHALINFGESSLLAIGPRPDGHAWPVFVRDLDGAVTGEAITIQGQSLSSSASFGRTHIIAGRSYSHVIDPRSGRPLEHALTVTVLAPTATAAEVLSTALLVWQSTGGVIPRLPAGVSAYQVGREGELVPCGRASSDATVCPVRL
jgi:FAD:protein FMN transferase